MTNQDIDLDVILSDDNDATEIESDEWMDRDELGIVTAGLRGSGGYRSGIRHTIVGNRVHRNLPGV